MTIARGRKAGWAFWAAALALLLCAFDTPPRPGAEPSPIAAATDKAYMFHGHGTAARPVKVQDLVGGRPMYVLKATDVYYSTSSSKGLFYGDQIYFYKGSVVRLRLTAPVANLNRTTYDFVLHGGVRAVSATGVVLTCDSMSYSGITQLLTASGHVRATDAQGDVLTGDKAVADLDLQQIHMTGDVGIGRQR
jgi:LPS export ABC transporter protein LptC